MSKCLQHYAPSIAAAGRIKNIKNRQTVLKTLCREKGFIDAVSECCWNITNNSAQLTAKQKVIKRKYLNKLNNLGATKGVSTAAKRQYLQKGGFPPLFPLLLAPIVTALTTLLAKKIIK
jgi:hypothetical protein